MTSATLSAPTTTQTFPAGTTDPGFTYTVAGTLVDGTPFSQAQQVPTFDLAPGTYTGVVSKLGVSSQPSAPLTIAVPTPVTLSVPDATQPAVLA